MIEASNYSSANFINDYFQIVTALSALASIYAILNFSTSYIFETDESGIPIREGEDCSNLRSLIYYTTYLFKYIPFFGIIYYFYIFYKFSCESIITPWVFLSCCICLSVLLVLWGIFLMIGQHFHIIFMKTDIERPGIREI